jgi:hypothetical protein
VLSPIPRSPTSTVNVVNVCSSAAALKLEETNTALGIIPLNRSGAVYSSVSPKRVLPICLIQKALFLRWFRVHVSCPQLLCL